MPSSVYTHDVFLHWRQRVLHTKHHMFDYFAPLVFDMELDAVLSLYKGCFSTLTAVDPSIPSTNCWLLRWCLTWYEMLSAFFAHDGFLHSSANCLTTSLLFDMGLDAVLSFYKWWFSTLTAADHIIVSANCLTTSQHEKKLCGSFPTQSCFWIYDLFLPFANKWKKSLDEPCFVQNFDAVLCGPHSRDCQAKGECLMRFPGFTTDPCNRPGSKTTKPRRNYVDKEKPPNNATKSHTHVAGTFLCYLALLTCEKPPNNATKSHTYIYI